MNKKIDLSKLNIKKELEFILIFFLIIQPIFDFKIFYNSISTLIRVIIIGILFVFYFFMDKNKKKYYAFVYLGILFVYIFFHHINALNFTSLVPGNFNYSLNKELLYFLKMITPFLLIYVLVKSNINNKKVFLIIKIIVLLIGLTIITSNFFLFSYSSYNDELIKANFFSWFNNSSKYTYQELSSKGLFEYANQISAILIMFLPICLISYIEKKSWQDILIIIINIFSLFLLSTKVAVFGIFVVFVYTMLAYFYDVKIIKKQNFSKKILSVFFVIILFYSLILPINPSFMRIDETNAILTSANTLDNNIATDNNNITEQQIITAESTSSVDYIEQNYLEKEIKKEFIEESYPYKYDPEFWLKIFEEPRINRVDYRFMELAMIKRVVEINNNKLDILFGITNTRLQNIFNIEQDFVVQYYALGVIGLILIFLPYFILLIFYVCKTIKNKFKNLNIIQVISFITIILLFGISYFSGNLLNSLSFTIYYALLFKIMVDDNNKNLTDN